MNWCFKVILFTMCFLLYKSAAGQSDSASLAGCHFSLSGKVIDGESKQPLIGATITIYAANKGSVSNENGEYFINNLCKGKFDISCEYLGFKTIRASVNLLSPVNWNFVLHADTCVLESIVIHGHHNVSDPIQPIAELKGKDLDRTRGVSLGEALKSIPGVNSIQTGPTLFKPVIQGMYGNRVLILNNGVRQEGQQWGSEHAPEIDPFIATRISVIKGAAGVMYGSDAIGGVILIDPKALRREPGSHAEINLVGLSNNFQGVASGIFEFNSRKIKGLSGRMQGTIKKAGNSKTPDYYLKNTAFQEKNFSWALGYQYKIWNTELFYSQFNSDLGIFSGSDLGNLTDLERAIKNRHPLERSGFSYNIGRPKQEVSHELFKIKSSFNFKKTGKIDIVLARQYNYRAEFDKHNPYNKNLLNKPQTEFQITTHTTNIVFDQYDDKAFKGSTGINFITQGNSTTGTVASFIPNFRSYAGGIFFVERWKKNLWELEGGLRYDSKLMNVYQYENNKLSTSQFKFSNFSGSLGAHYTINNNLQILSNFGTCFRPPAVNELFSNGLHQGVLRIETGDRNLKPEISYNLNFSLNYKIRKAYGEITVYQNYIKNYIFLAPELTVDSSGNFIPSFTLNTRGAFSLFQYKQTNSSFSGIDLTLNDSINKNIILSIKASVLRAINTKTNEYLILTPPANLESAIKYSFNLFNKVSNGYVQFSNLIVAKKSKVPIYQDLQPPPPGYAIFNFETAGTFEFSKQKFDLIISVNNLFNTRYRDYLNNFRYYTDAVGRNLIIRLKIPLDFNHPKQ